MSAQLNKELEIFEKILSDAKARFQIADMCIMGLSGDFMVGIIHKELFLYIENHPLELKEYFLFIKKMLDEAYNDDNKIK